MVEKPIKVLIINTFQYFGGAAVAAQRLFKALQDHKEVTPQLLVQTKAQKQPEVQAIANSWIAQKKALVQFSIDRLYFWQFEKSKEERYAFSPAYMGVDISQHPLVKEADIIHLHWIVFGFLSLKSLKKLFSLGKPIVWTLHDMWAFTGGCHHARECNHYENECGDCFFLKKPATKDLSHQLFMKKREVYQKASLHLAGCSNWIADQAHKSGLFKNESFPKSSIQAIPNPIDHTVYQPIDKVKLRQKYSLDPSKKYLLFGSVKLTAKRKGIDYFIEALKILKQKYPKTSEEVELLVFGGAGEEIKSLLPYPVHLRGLLSGDEALVENYNLGDILVMPSLEENLPNTIMEALACGTPSVAFEIGGIPDLIDHQQNGYLAKYQDAANLADGIYWALYTADQTQLKANARQKVLDNFTESVVANQYVQLYKKILA